jgi:hypothetical protein
LTPFVSATIIVRPVTAGHARQTGEVQHRHDLRSFDLDAPACGECLGPLPLGNRRAMSWARIPVFLVAMLAIAGCGGGNTAESTDQPGEVSFDLSEMNDSNVAGARVLLTYVDQNRTRILVDGIDQQEPSGGGPNPVELREGSCDEPGEVVLALPKLRGSSTQAEVPVGMAQLFEGSYTVIVELAGGGEQIACGDVPNKSTGG